MPAPAGCAFTLRGLAVDKEGYYRPCKKGEPPLVPAGRIYLHNRSGARKATASFFTKDFAVAHLLDQALEPALADHLRRLDAQDDDAAAESFFDFRVADISMGSAHFLVAGGPNGVTQTDFRGVWRGRAALVLPVHS